MTQGYKSPMLNLTDEEFCGSNYTDYLTSPYISIKEILKTFTVLTKFKFVTE